MNSMNEIFEPTEKLLRAVLPNDVFWRNDGTLTSAAFKDHNGLSVDRLFNRSLQEGVDFIKSHLNGKVVWVTYQTCIDASAVVKYLPVQDNEFHSEIHRSNDTIELSKGQARQIARSATIITESYSYA